MKKQILIEILQVVNLVKEKDIMEDNQRKIK